MAAHPWKVRGWAEKRARPQTAAERERKKRIAEIGAAVLRMKLREEGRLK